MQILADDQGNVCLVSAIYFTSCYNSNVLPQSGMSQYNGLKNQLRPKFQTRDSFTEND